jgi:hypothetical protein
MVQRKPAAISTASPVQHKPACLSEQLLAACTTAVQCTVEWQSHLMTLIITANKLHVQPLRYLHQRCW